jgi:transcriptional regulator with XRE-family HTH domain
MSSGLIETARESSGLSQADLAELAGTSRPTLNAYERGRKCPNASTLSRIVDAAGFELTIARRVVFRAVPAARGAEYFVPDHLWRLSSREALRTLTLPRNIEWSTEGERSFDLADRHDRVRCYEIVLREGTPDDIMSIVDGCLLVEAWSEIHLPRALRIAWQRTIDAELE